MAEHIFRYVVPAIPDTSHHRLITLCGGNVSKYVFRGFEQLLRTVANFEDNQLAIAIRFIFNPKRNRGVQNRLKLEIAVKTGERVSADTVYQLIEAGPLQEFYDIIPEGKFLEDYELPEEYRAACEVIRYEEKVKPLVSQDQNKNVPNLYYSLQAFEAREDNDYLMLDAFLSKVNIPCCIELLIRPVDHSPDLETHYKYICQLMSVNQLWDELAGGTQEAGLYRVDSMGERIKLGQAKARDPMADEILREQEEVHRKLRQPQLLFHIKTFSIHPEQAMMLASMVVESGISGGKYRIISYQADGPCTTGDWFQQSQEDSRRMNVSLHAMYAGFWGQDLPKVWKKMGRLCRLANVDELKGLFRLPVGGYGSPRCIRKATDPQTQKLKGKLRFFSNVSTLPPLNGGLKIQSQDNLMLFRAKTKEWQTFKLRKTSAGEFTVDIEVEANNATIAQSLPAGEVHVIGQAPKELIRVESPRRFGGTILIGYDLESENPKKHKMDLKNLQKEFRDGASGNLEIHLPIDNIAKHVFVAGVPGSGKTITVFNLLVQLFQHGVPFVVIEPAKTEYRILKTLKDHPDPSVRDLASELRIYTPGNEVISPLRFNPLAYPKGVTLDEHISNVLACFQAAMPMGGPLEALIAEAVEEVYFGRKVGDFPQMDDLLEAARRIMEAKKYEGEIKSNLQAAIEVRLGLLTRRSVGKIFRCYNSVPPVEELLSTPTVIEMDSLSQEHACLLTLFLLSAFREQIRVDAKRRTGGLKHVTVIEEAHNLVGRSGPAQTSEDAADPKAFAAEYVSRMLAELRALGEGMIIADQLPSAVAPEVVKNTGTKIANRLVSVDDREGLGGAMLLGGTELEEIARLSPGECFFYTEGLYRPRRVQCLDANTYLQLPEFPTGEMILPFIIKEKWYEEAQIAKGIEALNSLRAKMNPLKRSVDKIKAIVSNPGGLYPDQVTKAEQLSAPEKRKTMIEIKELLEEQLEDLKDSYNFFLTRVFNPTASSIAPLVERFDEIKQRAFKVEDFFENNIAEPYSELHIYIADVLEDIRIRLE